MYIQVEDALKPQYIVTVIHSEYEQTVRFFVNEKAARDAYTEQLRNRNEVYLSKLID